MKRGGLVGQNLFGLSVESVESIKPNSPVMFVGQPSRWEREHSCSGWYRSSRLFTIAGDTRYYIFIASAANLARSQREPSLLRSRALLQTILHLIETSGPGGAETVFLELIRSLDPARWRCVAVIPPAERHIVNSDWLRGQLRTSGIETIELEERGSFDVRSFSRLVRTVRREPSPLVHAHLFGSAVRAGLLSRITGIRSIATLHGHGDISRNERFKALKIALINQGVRRLVFVSEPLRRAMLSEHSFRDDITAVVPNGLDTGRYVSADGAGFRAALGIAKDAFVVGTVGNLTPAKGIDVFLRAAAILKARSPSYKFVVVGDLKGEQGEKLAALRSALGLTQDVIFAGFRSDVPRAMAAFDLYALTSSSEGFSIALVEAMASGLPAVATRCGGPEQIIEEGVTGLLVANGSAEAVAAAVELLRRSPADCQRIGDAARRSATDHYAMAAHVAAYEEIYEAALSDGRRTRLRTSSSVG
jgi:glycosyltransferase involved in cell wall biosynthesis